MRSKVRVRLLSIVGIQVPKSPPVFKTLNYRTFPPSFPFFFDFFLDLFVVCVPSPTINEKKRGFTKRSAIDRARVQEPHARTRARAFARCATRSPLLFFFFFFLASRARFFILSRGRVYKIISIRVF